MDPAAREFSHTIENLKAELLHFKTEQNKLKFQISGVFEENKRLINELKENVEMRYLDLSESEVGLLKQKLEAAVASKNAALEMWQAALQQLEKQEKLLLGQESIVATERSELEKQFLQMKESCNKGLNVLSQELSACSSELSKLKKDLEAKSLELDQCKIDLCLTQKELDSSKKTISELEDSNSKLAEKSFSLESSLSESDKSLKSCKENISILTAKNAELSATVSELDEENKKLKSQMLSFERDAKESLLAAEEAILEKKEIICKEDQYKDEIERLKSSVGFEVEKVSLSFKAELKDVQRKSAEKIQDLLSEIDSLHKQLGEKQNMFERANREKQALESKFDLLFSENSSGMSISSATFDDMCKRLTMAEKAKDELELKASSLETLIQEVRYAKDQEIQYLLDKNHSLNERLKNLSKDFSQMSSDRIRLSDEVSKLRRKFADQEKVMVKMRAEYTSSISNLVEESRNKQQTLKEQLHSTEERYKNICSELQNLLETEFQISNKMKAEFEDFISQSETALKELYEENVQLKSSNTELINILHQNNLRIPSDILMSLT